MKPQITQDDLSKYVQDGDTIIINYRRAFDIQYSAGASQYVLRQVYREYRKLPLTMRGRYMAVSPERFDKLIYENKN